MAVTGSGDAEADRVLVCVREVVAVDADAVREQVVVLELVKDFDTAAVDVPLLVVVAEVPAVRVCVAEKVAVLDQVRDMVGVPDAVREKVADNVVAAVRVAVSDGMGTRDAERDGERDAERDGERRAHGVSGGERLGRAER